MRIHVVVPGFTPEVFIDKSAPIFRIGIEKLVSLHTPYPDKETERRVEATIQKIEGILKTKAEKRVLRERKFTQLVDEIRHFLEGFGNYDEIYLHLEGGERHIGLAMIYASFFVKKRIHLVFATEYGGFNREYNFEEMSPVPAYKLPTKQKEVLRLVAEKEGQTLTDISSRINAKEPSKIAPAVFRQLKVLIQLQLVSLAQNGKKLYSITPIGKLFL